MATSEDKSGYYLWFDSEFTGLDLDVAQLLQVALVITDKDLHRCAPPEGDLNLYVTLGDGVPVSTWLEENIPDVLRQCRSSAALDIDDVDSRLADYVDAVLGPVPSEERQRPILAGNSIHNDWYLVRKYLPRFSDRMHYRHLDVSSLKIQWKHHYQGEDFDKTDPSLIRKHFDEAGVALDTQPHDAYYDVIASIAELSFYRNQLARHA